MLPDCARAGRWLKRVKESDDAVTAGQQGARKKSAFDRRAELILFAGCWPNRREHRNQLLGRAECFLVGQAQPLKESIRRLQAYAEAGADVLYAPGVRERADIQVIVAAVSPKPINVLTSANTGLKGSDLAEMCVRRIRVGSSLAPTWSGFIEEHALLA
jgi:hypothetical protein